MFGSSSLLRLACPHPTQKERHTEVLVTDGMTQFEGELPGPQETR